MAVDELGCPGGKVGGDLTEIFGRTERTGRGSAQDLVDSGLVAVNRLVQHRCVNQEEPNVVYLKTPMGNQD